MSLLFSVPTEVLQYEIIPRIGKNRYHVLCDTSIDLREIMQRFIIKIDTLGDWKRATESGDILSIAKSSPLKRNIESGAEYAERAGETFRSTSARIIPRGVYGASTGGHLELLVWLLEDSSAMPSNERAK